MLAKKFFLGLIDTSREIRRPPLVRMDFLYKRSVSSDDVALAGSRLKAKDLIGLLIREFTREPAVTRTRPVVHTFLHVLTPERKQAARISFAECKNHKAQ